MKYTVNPIPNFTAILLSLVVSAGCGDSETGSFPGDGANNIDGVAGSETSSDVDTVTDSNTDADTESSTGADTDSDTHTYTNSDTHTYTNSGTHTYTDSDTHTSTDSDTYTDTGSDTDTPDDTVTDTDANTDTRPARPFKLHPLGDSTTEAYELESAWRYWLWKDLVAAGFSVDFVGSRKGTNEGSSFSDNDWDMDHDGHTSAKASEVLDGGLPRDHTGSLREWAPKYAADIAVIWLGTNDIRGRRSTEDIIGTFEAIIEELRAANGGVDVVLCLLPYWDFGDYKGSKGAVDSLNAAIPNMTSLATADSKIEIVDLNTDYSLSDHRDGIHPGESGAKKIAERLLPVVSGFMN